MCPLYSIIFCFGRFYAVLFMTVDEAARRFMAHARVVIEAHVDRGEGGVCLGGPK